MNLFRWLAGPSVAELASIVYPMLVVPMSEIDLHERLAANGYPMWGPAFHARMGGVVKMGRVVGYDGPQTRTTVHRCLWCSALYQKLKVTHVRWYKRGSIAG